MHSLVRGYLFLEKKKKKKIWKVALVFVFWTI